MSLTKKYSCDLCREVKEPKELVCLYWDSTIKNRYDKFGSYTLKHDLNGSDKHICDKCIDLIKSY